MVCCFSNSLLQFAVLSSFSIHFCQNVKVQMKVVDEPVNYEHGAVDPASLLLHQPQSNDWSKTVRPVNFSGPYHLHQLVGHCFSWSDQKYKYELCPFQNITQQELSSNSWNRYKGILGVWGEWKLKDNRFTAMQYLQGDKCDEHKNRSALVDFKCKEGQFGEISEVKEPQRCQYEVTFSSQLVCHPHALLVYPWLSDSDKKDWDEFYTNYKNEVVSKKDFETHLQHLFMKAGLLLKHNAKLRVSPPKPNSMSHLNTCDIQLIQLRTEMQHLREENAKLIADLKKLSNDQ